MPLLQLYNLTREAEEINNIYNQHPEGVDRLKNLLEQYKVVGRSTPIGNDK
jgi:hypothetical protein